MKKYFLSGFVIIVFIGYAVNKNLGNSNQSLLSPIAAASDPTASPPAIAAKPASATFKDGQYTGPVTDAYYGNVQVRAVISGGKIVDVQFLQYPNDRQTSVYINSQAMPILKQETIQAQSASVNGVSGATQTSRAYIQSLRSALSQAKA